jgi:hypothetical protein
MIYILQQGSFPRATKGVTGQQGVTTELRWEVSREEANLHGPNGAE